MSSDTLEPRTISMLGTHKRVDARRRAQIRLVYPGDVHDVIELEADRVVLGRNPGPADGAPAIQHRTVSRQHFAIEWDPAVRIDVGSDVGSRNGSWVNGRRLGTEKVPLADGSVIRLGDVIGVYEIVIDVADAPEVSSDAVPGLSPASVLLRAHMARAARDPSPVLIIGETGTGKELVARELHRLSERRGELVALNCAALSSQLIESQLFGHEKGAFTGATSAQPGLFRAAEGGSILLDEIGDMPLDLQPKLLRAIQQGEVIPVGATRPVSIDVRVIAATNRELVTDIDAGRFRRDLYARLALWELRVAPLRARRGDLFGWVDRLYRAWTAKRPERELRGIRIEPDAAEALLLCNWPENLRGLDRLVHELAARDSARALSIDDLPGWLRGSPPPAPAGEHGVPTAELPRVDAARPPAPTKEELVAALERNRWSIRATAKEFGRDRRQIYRWMESFAIEKP